jgi:hypothetical protein
VVEADPAAVRETYQAKLRAIGDAWERELVGRGGGLVRATTSDRPVDVVRAITIGVAGPGASAGLREKS